MAAVDRQGRNLYDVLTTLEYFTEKGVVLRVDDWTPRLIIEN